MRLAAVFRTWYNFHFLILKTRTKDYLLDVSKYEVSDWVIKTYFHYEPKRLGGYEMTMRSPEAYKVGEFLELADVLSQFAENYNSKTPPKLQPNKPMNTVYKVRTHVFLTLFWLSQLPLLMLSRYGLKTEHGCLPLPIWMDYITWSFGRTYQFHKARRTMELHFTRIQWTWLRNSRRRSPCKVFSQSKNSNWRSVSFSIQADFQFIAFVEKLQPSEWFMQFVLSLHWASYQLPLQFT